MATHDDKVSILTEQMVEGLMIVFRGMGSTEIASMRLDNRVDKARLLEGLLSKLEEEESTLTVAITEKGGASILVIHGESVLGIAPPPAPLLCYRFNRVNHKKEA